QKTFDALLLKRSLTRVDSFFINNEPAPPLLLSLFFQEQGQISQTATYTFWVKGLNRSALSMIVNETTGQVIATSMSRNVNNFISTSTKFIDKPIAVSVFPNPTSDYLQLSFEKESSQPWWFTLFNNLGQVVQQQSLTDASGNVTTTIELSGDLPSGHYFFLLENEEGLGVASQKIVLKR
ncbi:MAG: T9SS type A sorting domain-containing protein, partial [Bacteroidota bacterium]